MAVESSTWDAALLSEGRYLITEKLGEGGMAIVFRARDRRLETDVAIKVPRPAIFQKEQLLARFRREIKSLVKLSHPHICTVQDVGEHKGLPFAVMLYLSGGTLRSTQQIGMDGKRIPVQPHAILGWLGMIAKALDFIHEQHYVHRDVKPSNILFDAQGNAYLSDFGVVGLAAGIRHDLTRGLTEEGVVIGTPGYMAPEMIAGRPHDGRADQYSLAIVIYEMLTGRNPFHGMDLREIHRMQEHGKVPPPHEVQPTVHPEVSEVVMKGLAYYPTQRFSTCGALAKEFAAAVEKTGTREDTTIIEPARAELHGADTPLQSQTVSDRPVTPTTAAPSAPMRSGRWLIGALILAAITAGAFIVWKTANPVPANKPRAVPLVVFIQFVENRLLEEAVAGVHDGLNEAGFTLGLGYTTKRYCANKDKAELRAILAEVKALRPDAIVTLTTPVMIAAAREIHDIPIVFTVASNPKIVDVFVDGQCPANLVGVHDDPPLDKVIALALKEEPSLKTVGALWHPDEPNARVSAEKLRQVCRVRNLVLKEQEVFSEDELARKTAELCQAKVQVIVLSADSLTTTGLPLIVRAARQHSVPIYSTEPSMVRDGVKAAIGDDYRAWGKQSGQLLAKVLHGTPPAQLEIAPTKVQTMEFAAKK